jgi:fibronectin type 3 domain-containing protein
MKPLRLARTLAAVLMATLLLPQVAVAAPTPTTLPAIRLACTLVVPNPLTSIAPNRAVVCKWVAPDGVTVSAYRVFRSVDGGSLARVASVAAGATLRYADRNIRTGHTYRYLVTGLNATGTRVAKSALVRVYVGRPAEPLSFNCSVVIDEGTASVPCRWSDTTRASAVKYVLYRSVNGGAREAIYRTGEDGRRSFRDRDVKPGQSIRYAVVALSASGRIVAYGGPDRVVIPE